MISNADVSLHMPQIPETIKCGSHVPCGTAVHHLDPCWRTHVRGISSKGGSSPSSSSK
eukprot:c28640_g1_i1 orf=2-172(-)